MIVVPAPDPVTRPVVELIFAIDEFPLDHMPPVTGSVSVVVPPVHTVVVPEMGLIGLTVTVLTAKHPPVE
jgi:hypothetical protein